MEIGHRGLSLIKGFEKLELDAYHGAADPAHVWTIGYGHTRGVKPGMTIDEATAELLLRQDVSEAAEAVNRLAGTDAGRTTQAQFDAMVSLTFNIGADAFKNSTVLKRHKASAHYGVPEAFLMWRKSAGRTRRGLLRRRCMEAALYCADRFV